ncbi:MAG: hypothetical protein KJ601_06065 [Nanoarchaeota archaeon]|nr:hypothetical protein [Nanoarchaeota archaeon]MBU1703923.1 hypothetical protein [Nanoarchaeota archaeon]
MFEFVKNLFKKPEQVLEIPLDKLDEWLDNNATGVKEKLQAGMKDIKLRLYEEIEKANNNITVLEEAELRNPNIPMRAKHFMHGNRLAYVKYMRNFLDRLHVGNEFDSMVEFAKGFDSQLEEMNKSTARAYNILQEFFAHESKNIALNVKNMDNITKEIQKQFEDSNVLKITLIKDMIASLKNKTNMQKDISNSLINKKNEREQLMYKRQKLETICDEFKTSEEFDEYKGLKAFRDKTKKQIQEHSSQLSNSFSVLEHALKKFSRQLFEHEDLIEKYQKDAAAAIVGDSNLEILSMLEKLKTAIYKGNIDLKDKKRERTLEEINKLDKQYLTDFKNRHQTLYSTYKEIQEKLSSSDVEEKLNELMLKIDKVQLDIETLNNEIKELSSEVSKNKIEEIRQNLEENIKNFVNTDLRIVL